MFEQNYGLIAPMIARELIHNSNQWRKRLEFYRERVEQEIEKRNITCSIKDRVGEYVALFTLAGEVINVTLNVSLDIDKVYEFFFTNIVVANDEEANMGKNAYYTIMKYVSEHRDLFADAGFMVELVHNLIHLIWMQIKMVLYIGVEIILWMIKFIIILLF